MVNRFLKLSNCINTALTKLGQEQFENTNINVLNEISEVLEPIETAVKELSKNDSNLFKAEGVLIFLLNKLQQANTNLAKEMMKALKIRINERRNKDIISLFFYEKCLLS